MEPVCKLIVSSRDGEIEHVSPNVGDAGVLPSSLVYFAHPTCLPGGQGQRQEGVFWLWQLKSARH